MTTPQDPTPLQNVNIQVRIVWPDRGNDAPDLVNQFVINHDAGTGGFYVAFGHAALLMTPGGVVPADGDKIDLPVTQHASLFMTAPLLYQLKIAVDQQLEALQNQAPPL